MVDAVWANRTCESVGSRGSRVANDLAAADIYGTVETLQAHGISFMSVPDTYYEAVDTRVSGHGEDLVRLRRDRILIDGAPGAGQGLLLQIFTETVIGPIFFEIIQRKGNQGFGEGNFRALFESIERDQIRRGVLKPELTTETHGAQRS